MDFTLLPDLTAFMIGFMLLAAVGVVVALATITLVLTDNHTVRVRRHESVRAYYGHLVLGH